MQDYIEMKNICKSFGENIVLDKFSAKFPVNKTSCIMGASGQGKTTLLKIILGLIKADSGEIIGLSDKKISAVFQEDRLIENLSAFLNIQITSNLSEKIIMDNLAKIGLSGFENSPVQSLSGGMKRRVAILRALLSDCDTIVLDEPFKGLDDETKDVTINLIKSLTLNKTLILVTHIKEEAISLNYSYQISI